MGDQLGNNSETLYLAVMAIFIIVMQFAARFYGLLRALCILETQCMN